MASTAVTIYGNLTSDPELKFLTGGAPKLEFSIACNEYWNDKDGERQRKDLVLRCCCMEKPR